MPTMLFGLFSRKQDHPVDIPRSPPQDSAASSSPRLTMEPIQLRTPSPSVGSAMNAAGPSTPPRSAYNLCNRPVSPLRNSLSQLAVRSESDSPDSSQTLHRLISSVPAKTLHSFTLTHLRHAPPAALAALASFYSDLQPPPQLHCVRCHKDYVEIDNDDRSCLVPHDDDSALVERVGRAAKRRGGEDGAEYETLWQCCGKTVEGDGDQGPPDGWCYEGRHTTDAKRARFREDSTLQDDKLVSCIRKNCHGVRTQLRLIRNKRHKRTRSLKDAETTGDDSSGDESRMDLDGSASAIGSVRGRTKRKATHKPTEKRAKSTDGRPAAKPKSTRRAASVSAKPKSRAKKPASKKLDEEEEADQEDEQAKPKKRRKVA